MVMNSAEARRKIENASDLPSLPSVVNEIIRLANSPRTNASDVGSIIEQDQALTTKVLKLVNSAFYGFPGQIKTVQHAVVIIGFNKVKNVVMSASLFDMTKGRQGRSIDIPQFWLYSLGCAIGARVAIRDLDNNIQPDDAFVAGLIHSLGVIIMDQIFPADYAMVKAVCEEDRITLNQAERKVLGFTSAQVGSWVAEKWRLPKMLNNSIKYSAKPALAREDQSVIVSAHIGDSLSRALNIGSPGDSAMMGIDQQMCSKYSIDTSLLDSWIKETLEELKLAKEFINLIEG